MSFVGPFPTDPIVTRLADEVALLRHVGNVADLQTALKQKPRAMPAAYVLPIPGSESSTACAIVTIGTDRSWLVRWRMR